jgi:hypothetical protein
MLPKTLDMPDEALAEDDNSEECAILCESGARPGVYGLLVTCCAMSESLFYSPSRAHELKFPGAYARLQCRKPVSRLPGSLPK